LAPNKIYADFVPIGGEDLVGNLLAMPPNLIFPKKKKGYTNTLPWKPSKDNKVIPKFTLSLTPITSFSGIPPKGSEFY